MSTPLFPGATSVIARALYLGERLDVKALEATARLSPMTPLCLAAGERGCMVCFRYGVVVLFNVAPLEEASALAQLKSFVGEPFDKPDTEDLELKIAPEQTSAESPLTIASPTVERIQVVAEILARSVALARYEATVRESFSTMEGWAHALQQGRKAPSLQKQLLKNLGKTIVIQSAMTGRIEIDDKPELLWERPDLERFYLRLEDEFELHERDKVLERKLSLISSTAEMLINLVDNKHAHRLEWYIIGLIVAEIIITLVTIAFGIAH